MLLLLPLLFGSAHAEDKADTLAEQASESYRARDTKRARKLAERSLAIRENGAALSVLLLSDLDAASAPLSAKARRSEAAANEERAARAKTLEDTYNRLERIQPDAVALGIVRTVLAVSSEGDLLPVLEPACPPEAKASFDAAEAAFAAGNQEKAKTYYDAALEGCPTNSLWWTWSGDAFHAVGNTTGAMARYERALEIDPCNHVAHRFEADTMFALPNPSKNDIDKLTGHAIDAVVCNPHYEAGWSTLGGLIKGMGRGNDLRTVDPLGYEMLVARTAKGEGDALDRRVAAVTAVLGEGAPDSALWKILAVAKDANLLTEAVAFETLDAEIADAYRARRLAMKEGLRAWIVGTRMPQGE